MSPASSRSDQLQPWLSIRWAVAEKCRTTQAAPGKRGERHEGTVKTLSSPRKGQKPGSSEM